VIGGALILLLIDSFLSSWYHLSFSASDLGVGSLSGASSSTTYGSLWGGIGIVAALLLLVGIAFYVIRNFLSEQVELPALPLPDTQVWMAFGAVEVVLMGLHWLIGKGSYQGFDVPDAYSKSPGWAWYVGMILGIVIIVGGYLKQNDPQPAAASGGGSSYPPPSPTYAPPPPPQPQGGYAPPPPPPPAPSPYSAPPPPSAPNPPGSAPPQP